MKENGKLSPPHLRQKKRASFLRIDRIDECRRDICSVGFFTEPRMTDAMARLSFYYSPYRRSPGSPVVGVVSPPTSRDNYVRDTPFSETCDRDCKMPYARSFAGAAAHILHRWTKCAWCFAVASVFFFRFVHLTPPGISNSHGSWNGNYQDHVPLN